MIQGVTRSTTGRLLQEMTRQPPVSWQRFNTLIRILGHLADSKELVPLASTAHTSPIDSTGNRKLKRVMEYVHQHLAQDLTQHDAAALVGMSPAAFSQFFRRAMGRTFVDFVNDLRIRRISHALLETDDSITEIAFASGFNNLSHFHLQFRRLRGTTPRAYRQSATAVTQDMSGKETDWLGEFR
jgi:AraC-like DNA-binding protein